MDNIEKSVIGALLIDNDCMDEQRGLLNLSLFKSPLARPIIKIMLDLHDGGSAFDMPTILETAKQRGVNIDVIAMSKCASDITGSYQIETHIRLLHQRHIRREVKLVGDQIQQQAENYDKDTIDLLTETETRLYKLNDLIVKGEVRDTSSVFKSVLERNDKILQNANGLSGVPSGFKMIDSFTGGFQDSDMIVLAARPGMGKTSLALQLATSPAIKHNIPTAIFSLEMSADQLFSRIVSQESDIPLETIMRKGLRGQDLERFEYYGEMVSKKPIFIDDTGGISVKEFRSKATKLKRDHNIQLIVIDYLQLMVAGEKTHSTNHEVGTISKTIKQIAKDLGIPIIILSQLSRAVETRGGDKRPLLSDLRDSGAIEQDADMVMFIYRPEYYGIMEDEEGRSTEGQADIMIAKHRNGSLGNITMGFDGERTKFFE